MSGALLLCLMNLIFCAPRSVAYNITACCICKHISESWYSLNKLPWHLKIEPDWQRETLAPQWLQALILSRDRAANAMQTCQPAMCIEKPCTICPCFTWRCNQTTRWTRMHLSGSRHAFLASFAQSLHSLSRFIRSLLFYSLHHGAFNLLNCTVLSPNVHALSLPVLLYFSLKCPMSSLEISFL